MQRRERLESAYILPSDAAEAVLVGRVWCNAAGGPCPVLVRDGLVLDLTGLSPTMSGLFEIDNLAEQLAASAGLGELGTLDQFLSGEAMRFAVDKVRESGNEKVILTDRGNSFGYSDLVVDFRNLPEMQTTGAPVVMDVTHSLQQPNQSSGVTGGKPALIETIAKAAIAVGADGLFIETHPQPSVAKSDGANMLPLDQLEGLLEKLIRIRQAVR